MIKPTFLIPALLTAAASLHAQRWQQRVDYSIDVTLNDSTHSLDGSVRIRYINHSPDTLSFIWIRCSANAFRNDRTAFSEALIREGRRDFYFSDKDRRGYLNRLEFRVDGELARVEDHPQYIDVIRVILPHLLAPGDSVSLSTIYHVQLPDNFTGDGYHGGVYEVTQWYPKPAVYDASGWHPDPFINQDVSYDEFGDMNVRIHVPAGFAVAAPVPADSAVAAPVQPGSAVAAPVPADSSVAAPVPAAPSTHYHMSGVPGFAWFASRRFHMAHDTLRLSSGRVVDLYSYYIQPASPVGRYGTPLLKDALRFYSNLLGEYPFGQATVVETRPVSEPSLRPDAASATYAGIVTVDSRDSLYGRIKMSIAKELAREWSTVIIGANGYRYPWMTEGIATYYYDRYRARDYHVSRRWLPCTPDTFNRRAVNLQAVLKADQPISTSAEAFTPDNYRIIAGYKTSIWMTGLQHAISTALFDSCMRGYFRQEAFHHSGPRDLRAAFSARYVPVDLDSAFRLLDTTGPVPPSPYHRRLDLNVQALPHPAGHNSPNIAPAIGFNNYDHWMIGAIIHNYNEVPDNWQVVAAPLYSPVSHQWNGLVHSSYAWYPRQTFHEIEAGINGSRFSTVSGTDSSNHAIFGGFYKVVPCIRLFLPQAPLSTETIELEGKVYLIGEKSFDSYVPKSTDSLYYPVTGKYRFRYLNQLTLSIQDGRALYPYAVNVQVQQAASFYRLNFNLHYFFNYAAAGGLAVRVFGAKFGYLGARNPAEDLTRFEPKLTAVRGSEDYTYGNYFVGRNDFQGLASQQIMMRDGDLKLRTDLFQGLQGRSDDWVAAINFRSTLPGQIVPAWLPLRLFLDVGTYAQAWSENPPTSHFLYVGGFELDLFQDVLRVYAPLVYSNDFSRQLKTVPGENGFFHKVSFSIDFQNLPFRKWLGYTPF